MVCIKTAGLQEKWDGMVMEQWCKAIPPSGRKFGSQLLGN
jgi:hypothetical protein